MNQKARLSPRVVILILLILLLLNLSALTWLGWPVLQNGRLALNVKTATLQPQPSSSSTSSPAPSSTPTETQTPTFDTPTITLVPIQASELSASESLNSQGVLLLSLRDGEFAHIFAYHPAYLPLTRLSSPNWDEIDPAVSPDGIKLAYASRQNGYWDLYVRDLESGEVQRITDTPEYDGKPSWSSDGQWLACESYQNGHLDIYLYSVEDPQQDPIILTEDPAAASSPSWSPQGRRIAFVSARAGKTTVWISDLDKNDTDRSSQVSRSPLANADHPAWSRDGRYLAWGEDENGSHRILVWDSTHPDQTPKWIASGDQASWSPDGEMLFSLLNGPHQTSLTTYRLENGVQVSPLLVLPGQAYGLAWKPGPLNGWLSTAIETHDQSSAPALYQSILTAPANPPQGRVALVPIQDVSAPYGMLSDQVDEAFQALRRQAGLESGWDVLSSLEEAYLPLTTPSNPGVQDNWLYTGRAFALNPLLLSAGWMALTREDFNGQTYWRVFLKARYQDGSAGIPLSAPAWDINARFTGDPQAYETGGQPGGVPAGYWIDLSELAQRFGWERLASLPNWRSFFPGIRFNLFVFRDGLDWNAAMREIYSQEALETPTSIPTPTETPTATLPPTRTPTILKPSATVTPSATHRPTLTSIP